MLEDFQNSDSKLFLKSHIISDKIQFKNNNIYYYFLLLYQTITIHV